MSKDNKDMHQTGWMTPPTSPFGGSKLDYKIKQAEELAKTIDEWAKGKDPIDEWTKPSQTEKKESGK